MKVVAFFCIIGVLLDKFLTVKFGVFFHNFELEIMSRQTKQFLASIEAIITLTLLVLSFTL